MSDLQVPIVDLEDLAHPSPARTARSTEAIMQAFGTYGLIYLRNHGIDPALLDTFYNDFQGFTACDEAEKRAMSRPDIWFQRGWTPPNTERAVIAGGQPDFKECFFAAPEPLDPLGLMEYPEIYAPNIWPEGHEGFRDSYLDIGHQLHEVGLALLRGAARALGLAPYTFEAAAYGASHVTRALRYLPLNADQVQTDILWGEEHTDFNLLTLLPGGRFISPEGQYCGRPDDQCGLYLRTRPSKAHPQGQMVPGKPPEGCVVAQVGQQLEILTGGAFLATPHVIKAPRAPGYSRVSMAHFIHLHAHQILFPLPPFQTPEVIKAYSPPVLAGTYGTKTLVDIGLAPREALSQLGYRHYDRLDTFRADEGA